MFELDGGHQVPVGLVDLEDGGGRDEEDVAGRVPADRLRLPNTETAGQTAAGDIVDQDPGIENISRYSIYTLYILSIYTLIL